MMSASSSKKLEKDEQVDNARKPKWLEAFLNKTFFDSCTAHPLHKNELNIYCINCDLPACQYCASSSAHRKHKILKIYRLIYKDVVALAAMEDHIDCSQIQLYKCNRHLVIALKPLPHTGSVKWNKASSCDICSRKLAEPDLYRYCSISCKVEAVLRKPNDSVPPFISFQRPQEKKEETTEPRKRLNKEKEETIEPRKRLNKEKKEETTEPRKRLNKEKKEEATESPKQQNKEKEETTEPPKRLNKEKKDETTKPPKRLNKDSQNRLNKEKKEETTEPPKRLNKEKKEETTEPPKRKNRRKGTPHRAPFF